jgi:hypothetical protein
LNHEIVVHPQTKNPLGGFNPNLTRVARFLRIGLEMDDRLTLGHEVFGCAIGVKDKVAVKYHHRVSACEFIGVTLDDHLVSVFVRPRFNVTPLYPVELPQEIVTL